MLRLPFELEAALRYLRPKRTFVSIITLISVLGVMLGVAVLIIVISVMTGFGMELRETILGFSPHLRVIRMDADAVHEPWKVAAKVKENPNVIAVAPYIMGKSLVEYRTPDEKKIIDAPVIRGVDPTLEGDITDLPNMMWAGEYKLRGDSCVVGKIWAQNLGIRVGDRISVFSPASINSLREARESGGEEAVLPEEFTVRGIFDAGHYEYNAQLVVISFRNAQSLFEMEDRATGIYTMVEDPGEYSVMNARFSIEGDLGDDYVAPTWLQDNQLYLSAIMVEKNVMFIILVCIMVVAAFCIVCTQITFVMQKTRDIGILKSIGATPGQIMTLFFGQSFAIGIMGVLSGLGAGILAVQYRNEFLHFMRKATGVELFPMEIYGFSELPAQIVPIDIAWICGVSFSICLLASLVPAFKAAMMQPVEALRHE
tara:strand:+ start:4060 stop:5340 length:1281 start_codon:yes stop_codon:yes gene_type:complete